MKVFISWSGDYSRQIGEVIREWLPNVMQFVKPYFSPSDIDKGKRWNNEISKELGQSQIGIIAMTAENLASPWIMFEAGAISKVVEEGLVCPIVFGINKIDLVGPLAGFQITAFNETEVRQLLTTINNAAKEAALSERSLDAAFKMWWPVLEEKVQAISSAAQPPSGPQRSQEELLEEVVENTRTIIRDLQPQVAAFNSNVVGTILGLLRGRTPLQAILELNEPATSDAVPMSKSDVIGGLTQKSG